MTGLCGNYNGVSTDDHASIAVPDLTAAWKVPDSVNTTGMAASWGTVFTLSEFRLESCISIFPILENRFLYAKSFSLSMLLLWKIQKYPKHFANRLIENLYAHFYHLALAFVS